MSMVCVSTGKVKASDGVNSAVGVGWAGWLEHRMRHQSGGASTYSKITISMKSKSFADSSGLCFGFQSFFL